MAGNEAAEADKSLEVYACWDARMREHLKHTVTDDLIAEHARNPLGQHSEGLERLLNYFRRAPQRGKYALLATKPHSEWKIVVLPGARGESSRFLDDRTFTSEKEALHAVFLERVRELMRG